MLQARYAFVALAAIISAVNGLSYPRAATLQERDCFYPKKFSLFGLAIWTPDPSNPNNITVDFQYQDSDTQIQTPCQRNASSPNVGEEGLAPRYACDNPTVEFIYGDGVVTVIEKACPNSGSAMIMEASGGVFPTISCQPTTAPTWPLGNGAYCQAVDVQVNGNFTSLQPAPP